MADLHREAFLRSVGLLELNERRVAESTIILVDSCEAEFFSLKIFWLKIYNQVHLCLFAAGCLFSQLFFRVSVE